MPLKRTNQSTYTTSLGINTTSQYNRMALPATLAIDGYLTWLLQRLPR